MAHEPPCNDSASRGDGGVGGVGGGSFAYDAEMEEGLEVYNATSAADLTWLVPIGAALYLLSFVTIVGNAMVMHAFRTEKRLQTVSTGSRVSVCILLVASELGFHAPDIVEALPNFVGHGACQHFAGRPAVWCSGAQ